MVIIRAILIMVCLMLGALFSLRYSFKLQYKDNYYYLDNTNSLIPFLQIFHNSELGVELEELQ